MIGPRTKDLAEAASKVQEQANAMGMGAPTAAQAHVVHSWLDRYDELVTSAPLRAATRTLFADEHYARAVEEAYKCLNNRVKTKSGLRSLDGERRSPDLVRVGLSHDCRWRLERVLPGGGACR